MDDCIRHTSISQLSPSLRMLIFMKHRLVLIIAMGFSLIPLGCSEKKEEIKQPSGSEYQPTTKLRGSSGVKSGMPAGG